MLYSGAGALLMGMIIALYLCVLSLRFDVLKCIGGEFC
jgi:hypothetical protein